jgi:hypothetical protein
MLLYRLFLQKQSSIFFRFQYQNCPSFIFCSLFQFILVHEYCHLFIELIDLKLKDFPLSCIKILHLIVLAIKNSVLHPLFQLLDLSIVS